MKRFLLCALALGALLVFACCTGRAGEDTSDIASEDSFGEETNMVQETTEISFSEESEPDVEITTEDETTDIQESSLSSEEDISDAGSQNISLEETTEEVPESTDEPEQIPVVSELPQDESKVVETIPNLILEPQPEGEYHTLLVGESMQLYSQIEGSELEDAMLLWTVSDNTVIGLGGKTVYAKAPGYATVTLSYSNGLKPVSISFLVVEREESTETSEQTERSDTTLEISAE